MNAFSILRIFFDTLLLALRAAWVIPRGWLAVRTARASAENSAENFSDPIPVFLYSQVAWADVWQRPQEMAVGLARHRPVLFFGPVQTHHRVWRLKGRWRRVEPGPGPGSGRLWVASPLIFPGEYRWEWARAINRVLLGAEARLALARLDPRAACGRFFFLTNSPFCDTLMDKLHPRAVVYDIIDDFVKFAWAPADGPRRESAILRRADLIFTGTQTLRETKTAGYAEAHFIACGVDFERFSGGNAQPEPPDLAALPRPILGYFGTLSDRLDRDLLEALARRFPKASLVLIGPVLGSFGPPIEGRNIHYLGLKPPEALAAYAARFDVALMPFAQTEAARAINPVKTLEYLAAGCRVVSTPIPDVERFFSDVVEIHPAVEPFLNAVARLLAERGSETDQEARRRGIERARSRSWGAMSDEMETHLAALDRRRS